MLSGEDNARERRKNNNRSNQQKSNFARAAHFFVHFFAVVLHDHDVKRPETFLWRKCRTCSRFFHCRSFSPCIGGRQHFSFCHRRNKIFMLFFKQKMSPLFFISRSRSLLPFFSLRFAGLPLFLFFSVFLWPYIPNVWT